MNLSSPVPTGGDDAFEIVWEDGERIFCRERRPDADGNLDSVLIVTSAAEHPTPASLDRLAHEYALKDELNGPWAVRPLALIRERGRTMLVLEDPGGEPLDRLLGAPMQLGRFLRLAIAITTALAQLHRRGLVHKDLKPANMLVNAALDEVRFTGFGIASRLSRERQALDPPETIAGTLAYMAPEQTGRMNRSIDSRSDLYALGITFYQMLTGALPFAAADPMEWVHCHIARRAVPPAERVKEVPGAVSAIVMKLLAKTAEERYQTAGGLATDLQHCLAGWQAQGRIEYFRLGKDDKPDRILIPENLYGRERELKTLLASFDRVASGGAPELVLVSGYSGIGKSALIHELKTQIAIGGLFASGKFDQHKHDIPYATLAQAFQSLIRTLLTKSEAELSPWRDALREALDPMGGLLVDLVPELQLIIGAQPPVPDVLPQNAQRRFQLAFRRFIEVFARAAHPLVLFLDDLQWLDTATLDLLEDLLLRSDLRHLLLIGAYRQHEVSVSHPLTRKLEVIRDSGTRVQEIRLEPLGRDEVLQFTADALRCEPAHADPLARLIHEKTGGNPFFLIQFLHALAQQELLEFDHDDALWRWELERIHAQDYTENVVDLMIGKLGGLPDAARKALFAMACLGNGADIATLSLVHGVPEQQLHADLREAARLELIEHFDGTYKFVHDRVQEAAYGLQPDEDKLALHLRIGIALAEQIAAHETSDQLYVVANQLNRGVAAVTSEAERQRIIAINLSAGRRARKSTAYDAAIAYLEVAGELLGEEAHPSRSSTSFAVALQRAECELLVGHLDAAEAQLLELSMSCRSLQANAEVTTLRAYLYTARGQLERSVDVCLEFLRQVGLDWSPHPTDHQVNQERDCLRSLAEGLSDDQLHALPPMTDPDHRATMAVFTDLVTPAVMTDRNLSDIMLLAAARLTLQHGICESACYPMVCTFGVFASNHADVELGIRLAQFGVVLADRHPQFGISGRALLCFGLHVTPWIRPIRSGQPFIQRGLNVSLAAGDLSFAAYSHRGSISVRLFCGEPLPAIYRDAEQGLAFFTEASGFDLLSEFLTGERNFALSLIGRGEGNWFEVPCPTGSHVGEGTSPMAAFFHYTALIQINVLAGRYDAALTFSELADKLYWGVRAYPEAAEYRFYTGLAQAAAYEASAPERREMLASGLRRQHRKLSIWSARVPQNFADRLALLAAEIARIEGRELEAEQLYEQSIGLAREAGFVQIEAIAAECAARFYQARGIKTVVLSYLRLARDCYLRWGADAKVRQLDEMYPQLRGKEPVLGPTSTIGAPVEQLDLATVLKVSEAVSGEIELEKLIGTLLRAGLEHAGAERGLLILPQGSELRIRAEAITGNDSVRIDLRDTLISGIEIPESLVLYTARTQESVILEDASASDAFGSDGYIRSRQARSVLSLPLVRQGKLVALLYLENNLAPRVFTPARVAILKFLASEAATALDNARLYGELRERESRIRRLVDANIIGICIFGQGGEIVDANYSFLKNLGYDREDLEAGRLRWTDLTPPEWKERTARAHAELDATAAIQPFEKEYFRRDGSRAPILIGAAAFDERQDQSVAFVLDLSERKRAEAEARDSERRYREAQTELAHANRIAVMGHLTASIAHEISQPNTAVVASAQAALHWLDRRPPELEPMRQALVRIIQNGIRASEVIERIRDLVKKKPPRQDSLAINAIIGEVIALIEPEAARSRVLVRTAFSDGLPEVVGDRVELQQVAVNLILNAIEAMSGTSEGPRELLIRTATADGGDVVVAVMDSGPGLPPVSLERLFDPFYTTKPDGLGIGLSICRSIIEAYGGKLSVSANLPRGAVFQFTLPASGGR